jgi:hypothetical protein
VLYCSGDNHLGDITRNYTDEEGVPIQQVGANNVLSVLKWLKSQQQRKQFLGLNSQLTDLVIMGCSAGSIASQIWANEIIKELNYPLSSSVVLDSYIGLFPPSIEGQLIYEFGICKLYFLPSALKELCVNQHISMFDFIYSQMNSLSSSAVPFLFIHSQTDRVQIKYYNYLASSYNQTSMDTDSFIATSNKILLRYNQLENFLVYYIDSDQHCYTPTPYLFYTDTDGLTISDPATGTGDDEISVGDDDTRSGKFDTNIKSESLNKWIGRVPLHTSGEQVSSQCSDQTCNSNYNNSDLIPKSFLHSSEGGAHGHGLDYEPSSLVQFIYSFPKVGSQSSPHKQNSTSYSLSQWKEYAKSMVAFPVILHSIFLFFGLLVIFTVMMRELSGRDGSGVTVYTNPSDPYRDSDGEEDVSFTFNHIYSKEKGPSPPKLSQKRTRNISALLSPHYLSDPDSFSPMKSFSYFLLFLILFFIFNFFYFIGYSYLQQGIHSSLSTIHTLDDSLSTLNDHLTMIINKEQNISLTLEMTTCDGKNSLISMMTENENLITDYQRKIESSLSYLAMTETILQTYFIKSLNIFIFLLFSLNLSLVMGYFLAVYKRFSSLLICLMILSIIIFILSMIFSTIYLILLVCIFISFCDL